jgi:hypothetical protein
MQSILFIEESSDFFNIRPRGKLTETILGCIPS